LTVQNAGKPFGGWVSAPDSAGDLRAPPDPLGARRWLSALQPLCPSGLTPCHP